MFLDFLPQVNLIRNVEVIRGKVSYSESDLHNNRFMKTKDKADYPAEVFLFSARNGMSLVASRCTVLATVLSCLGSCQCIQRSRGN